MFEGLTGSEASARAALARARDCGIAIPAGEKPFSLVVDLAGEPVGQRWFRGAATLALLCTAAISLAPGFSPFSAAGAHAVAPQQSYQMNAMLAASAERAGADVPATDRFDPDVPAEPVISVTSTAVRVRGAVTDGLYWSLRGSGVSSEAAAAYLQALSTRIDVGAEVAPFDRFDLVLSRDGNRLLYAALHRVDGPDVELLKWTVGGTSDWFDTDASGADKSAALMSPVAGRITSGFGMRHHPVLRFARMHAGIDFGAAWGSPIVAAADGEIVAAGWNGGYGRQVRVAHEGGIVTTYSHMSRIAAAPGEPVRQGQVIGHVGSTGLSTGPHLHFEVRVNGQAVDPMQVQMQRRQKISGDQRTAFNARLKQLKAIGGTA